MTIDERLERLTDRHEALTQTVDLLATMQAKNEVLQAKNETLMANILESIHSLERIALIHEHRITGLEGGESMRS